MPASIGAVVIHDEKSHWVIHLRLRTFCPEHGTPFLNHIARVVGVVPETHMMRVHTPAVVAPVKDQARPRVRTIKQAKRNTVSLRSLVCPSELPVFTLALKASKPQPALIIGSDVYQQPKTVGILSRQFDQRNRFFASIAALSRHALLGIWRELLRHFAFPGCFGHSGMWVRSLEIGSGLPHQPQGMMSFGRPRLRFVIPLFYDIYSLCQVII